MRLLNTTTLTLHTFFDKAVPEYAFLSHRWDEEEVTFQDLQTGRGPGMPGYAKIEGCCAQARSDGWKYAWIDSCCINKSSSAELSEATNQCSNGTKTRWYAMHICRTWTAKKISPNSVRTALGSDEAGRCKSCWPLRQ